MRIDFTRIDLVGVDFVRIDLVAPNQFFTSCKNEIKYTKISIFCWKRGVYESMGCIWIKAPKVLIFKINTVVGHTLKP